MGQNRSKPTGSHFWVGELTTHFSRDCSGNWDVHWGYGLLTHDYLTRSPAQLSLFLCLWFGFGFGSVLYGSVGSYMCCCLLVCCVLLSVVFLCCLLVWVFAGLVCLVVGWLVIVGLKRVAFMDPLTQDKPGDHCFFVQHWDPFLQIRAPAKRGF